MANITEPTNNYSATPADNSTAPRGISDTNLGRDVPNIVRTLMANTRLVSDRLYDNDEAMNSELAEIQSDLRTINNAGWVTRNRVPDNELPGSKILEGSINADRLADGVIPEEVTIPLAVPNGVEIVAPSATSTRRRRQNRNYRIPNNTEAIYVRLFNSNLTYGAQATNGSIGLNLFAGGATNVDKTGVHPSAAIYFRTADNLSNQTIAFQFGDNFGMYAEIWTW